MNIEYLNTDLEKFHFTELCFKIFAFFAVGYHLMLCYLLAEAKYKETYNKK